MSVFDFEPLVQDKMPTTGSKVLRALQNNETALLDLLVRESIQNSLDACKDDIVKSPIQVDFNIKNCSRDILSLFPELTNLNSCGTEILEIRDTGTKGLTGVAKFTNKSKSNFSKLVYDISNPQEKVDAGGSWGLGKTLYYKLGAGLVIFYSRIKNDTNYFYEERIAACFVEDETKTAASRKMPNLDSGIAWWGRKISNSNNATQAVTDSSIIIGILKTLQIDRFEDRETGTSIIIPFIRKTDLVPNHANGRGDATDRSYDWFYGFEGYLDSAVQRWYCLRLNNKEFKTGPALQVSINKEKVENSYPIFRKFQKLYNSMGSSTSEYTIEPITLRRDLGRGESGLLISTKLLSSELGMVPPDNYRSPFEYIECVKEGAENPVIFAFARKPGMIISWLDPQWVKNMVKTQPGEYILALFIPNSKIELEGAIIDRVNCATLEQYLRSTEKSDHSGWRDSHGEDIITRISGHIVAKIKSKYGENSTSIQSQKQNMGLMRYLAKAFMPEDWGSDARLVAGTLPSSEPKKSRNKNAAISITQIHYPINSREIIVEWALVYGKRKFKSIHLLFEIVSENGVVSMDSWIKDSVLGAYPCCIEEVHLLTKEKNGVVGGKKTLITTNLQEMITQEKQDYYASNNDVRFRFESNTFLIDDLAGCLDGWLINGRTILVTSDPTIIINLNIKTNETVG